MLVDEEKIEEKYKKEFNDFKNEAENKTFDSTKKYKELFDFIKSKNSKFKEIYLEEPENNLKPIQTNENVIDKDNITINIKLVDSCYKKEKQKEEHKGTEEEEDDDDKNKDKPEDNEDNGSNNSKINESENNQIKENNRCGCRCCNNKIKNNKNTCCVKKSLNR